MRLFCQLLLRGGTACLLLLLLLGNVSFSQEVQRKTYSGTVKDTKGESVAGASVSVKGTDAGVYTDENGVFSIEASQGATLVISSVGYAAFEQVLGASSNLSVVLQAGSSTLEDVIVVAYGTQRRKDVTAAISNVKSEDLVRTPAVTTTSALVGRAPGITARQTDGRPGAGTSIQIRNMGTPLYIIDGVQSDVGQFNNLNMNDIEDISILKDGSAAIYGVQAANGVIVVTTKRGRAGQKPSINLNGYYGLQNFTRFPKPANAYQYMRGLQESAVNQGRPDVITPEELEKWRVGTEKGYQSFDYYDMVMRPNVPQSYLNASSSGGGEKMNYYVSASHLNQDALIRDYFFKRTNIQANIDAAIAKGLKIGTQLYGRNEHRHQVGVPGLDDYFNPFLSIFTMWPTERPYANDNPDYINQTHNVNANPATYREDVTGFTDEIWKGFKGNVYAEYQTDFGLSARATASYNYTNLDFNGFEYTYDAYNYDEATDTYFTQSGWGNQNPWRERRKGTYIDRFAQFQLNYNKSFGDHRIEAVTAYERFDNNGHYMVVHTVPPNNYIPIMYFADQDLLIDEITVSARAGYIGRVNYNYKGKYYLEALARYDGSYLYRDDKRWGLFPGVSLGWRISEEPFLLDKVGNWLTDLKIRASYGETGQNVIDPFLYLSGYNYGAGSAIFNGGFNAGIDPRGLPITTLSWTTNISKNVGFDAALWNSKVTAQFDVFERKRSGLPYPRYDVLLPQEAGYGLPDENLRSDAFRGFEGAVNYNGKAGDLTFNLGLNFTFSRLKNLETYKPRYQNSWDEYYGATPGPNNVTPNARWNDRWNGIGWGYNVIGRFQSQEEIDDYPVDIDGQRNRTLLPGDFIYADHNDDGIINVYDERPIGYAEGANPFMSFGFTSSFQFKNFNLNMDWVGATMQSFFREWELKYPYQNNGNAPDYMLEDRWHRSDPFDTKSDWIPGTYPAIRKDFPNHSNFRRSDFWVTNITYLRLRNLEIGYTFPRSWISGMGMSNLRVYANGTNLFSLDNVKEFGIDPEIGPTNGLVYPQQRLYNFGFNVTF